MPLPHRAYTRGMGCSIHIVDAFADAPFTGNPAAVCLLEAAADPQWMQQVAAEMNLSETAFPVPRPGGGFDLRWFTPTAEVELCGHATLATAHVLWETGALPAQSEAEFHTASGVLRAKPSPRGVGLDFPAAPATVLDDAALRTELASVLATTPLWCGRARFDLLCEVDGEDAVRALRPDLSALRALDARGVIVTARASAPTQADFVSRFFAPAVGVDEDPVTGSAHCTLAPFWSERLGRDRLTGYQASARGGVVHVEVAGDRVGLEGGAHTVLRGTLHA